MKKITKKVLAIFAMALAVVASFAVNAFAVVPELPSSVVSAYTDGVQGVADGIYDVIGIALPVVLGVIVVVMVINFGIKFFKRLTGRS